MKIVISGAGGFLGKNILDQLFSDIPAEHDIIALSSDPSQLSAYSNRPGMQIIGNQDFLADKMNLADYTLLHLAYVRSSEFQIIKNNCEFTFDILQQAQLNNIKKIIHISSQSVYDAQRTQAAKETDFVKVSTLYDMGKYYLENWIADYCTANQMKYLNLRLSSLAGPNFPQRITSRLIKDAIETGKISINLNGQIFSYTHVRDMAQAIIKAMQLQDKDWNRNYNVGTHESYTIEDIAIEIESIMKKKKKPLEIIRNYSEANGINSSLDCSLFEKAAGWQAEYDLQLILKEEYDFQALAQRIEK
ncbi:MAG: NAD(P)-dependent oxidoreductase [Saccharofermentanales bacterium]